MMEIIKKGVKDNNLRPSQKALLKILWYIDRVLIEDLYPLSYIKEVESTVEDFKTESLGCYEK